MAYSPSPFVYIAYLADDGNEYQVKMKASVATALSITPVAEGTNPKWPYKHHMLRHFSMKNTASPYNIVRTIAFDSTVSAYKTLGGTITWIDGSTYKSIGALGERRDTNNR